MSEDDVFRVELIEAIIDHRRNRNEYPEVRVTTDFRKRMLRSIGWDENSPVSQAETVYGCALVVDDDIPAEPGFRLAGQHL